MTWYILLGVATGGLLGWFIVYLIRWRRSRPSDMDPVECHVRESDPEWKKYKMEDVREALLKVSTSNISDAQHHKGSIKGLRPVVDRGVKIVGPALTVSTINGDWAKAVEAIDRAGPGDEENPMHVKVGEKVLYSKYGGNELEYEGEKYLIMSQSEIYAVFE